MCRTLLKGGQQLDLVCYLTTRVRNDPAAAKRRSSFIDALTARGGIEIDFGHFISKERRRKNCGHTWRQSEEKKTDVNIAVCLIDWVDVGWRRGDLGVGSQRRDELRHRGRDGIPHQLGIHVVVLVHEEVAHTAGTDNSQRGVGGHEPV